MNKERDAIEQEIATLVYYMNGGLNYSDAYSLSTGQMKHMSEAINKHYETQNEAVKKNRR